MASFDESVFEEKLLSLKDTQDSIASLSSWCLTHKAYHEKIVSTWLNVLKKVKIKHRLVLFYLANDVIQYSKRKSLPFVESFSPALQKATKLVREDNNIRNKVMRLFKIWSERGIYEENFLVDLSNVLNRIHKNIQSVDVQEFQSSMMFSKIRKCKELEEDTDNKLNTLNKNHISFIDVDKFRNSLKDREHGDELLYEIDGGAASCNAYITSLETEINERQSLINDLEIAEEYYEREFQEAKIVVNAYKCFATRVRGVKRKLEEKIESMPSPIPFPDENAPSPSPEPKDNIYEDLRCPAVSGPGNYFPPSETKKENDDISPYSPNSDFDSEPINSSYTDDENKQNDSYSLDRNGISNSPSDSKTTPSNEFSASFTSESFLLDQSFLSGLVGGKNTHLFQGNKSDAPSSEWKQLSLSALLQTLMPSEGPNESLGPKNEVPQSLTPEKSAKVEETYESPESPPLYEKAKYPTIADEQILSQDTDMRFADVDDRNLLDFNDSRNPSWPGDDIDYRTEGKLKKTTSDYSQNHDNVDNVDMEMSDEEEKTVKTKDTGVKHSALSAAMPGNAKPVLRETTKPTSSKEGFMDSKESVANPLILNQNVPPLCNPTPAPYNSATPYDSSYNYSKPGAYGVGATYRTNNPPPFPSSGDGDASNMLPLLPPPPPPPPHPPQLWPSPFVGPPPQFANSPNFVHQNAMFFPQPPPPAVIPNPNPQMPVVSRQYRGNFRPFQRATSRFQRW